MLTAALPGQRMLGREMGHGMIRTCICPGEGKRLFCAGCPGQLLVGALGESPSHVPVDRDGQDGLDVAQHGFEMLWVLLEAHLCQNQRLADVWEWMEKSGGLLWLWRHLLAHTQTAHLPVRTLGWARRCRRPPCLCALCTFCPPRSCKRSRTRSEMEETTA